MSANRTIDLGRLGPGHILASCRSSLINPNWYIMETPVWLDPLLEACEHLWAVQRKGDAGQFYGRAEAVVREVNQLRLGYRI